MHTSPGHGGPAAPAPYDLLVRGGTVVTPRGSERADIAVRAGRIAALLPPSGNGSGAGPAARAARVLDASGLHVLPGLIDSHVHFRTPGLTHKEEWSTGSRAAVAGGVTTVIDMPNTVPPLVEPAELDRRRALIEGRSLVDYRFHAGIDTTRIEAMREWPRGAGSSFKVFLSGHHTAPTVVREEADLRRIFALAAEGGATLLFHSEDDTVFALLDRWQPAPTRYADYARHRPRTGALVATAKLVRLAAEYRVATHVVHVATREEADLLAAAAADGIPVTFEVTGHHLTFVDADISRLGPRIRLRPAIRDDPDRRRLWEAVHEGEAATIGSDHSPHTVEEKARPVPDVPPGLPGVQELFGTVWHGLRSRRPEESPDTLLPLLAARLALRPAQLFGLASRKGSIEAGKDADLVLVDAAAPWTMTPDRVHAKCGWSAYEGAPLLGVVHTTVRRGQVVYQETGGRGEFGVPDGQWLAAPEIPAGTPAYGDTAAADGRTAGNGHPGKPGRGHAAEPGDACSLH
ncbi:dihydroorotase [Streptomyces physcomitrii]|uniref:Dihydroorotase family protein n=1 Tax=Streptomyces physcomitrii TaxID=2724184 RepID=A0ABX1H4I5_9ACTN|nr:dihydroorotase family protein [Streptomyces physcomitrii]NKI42933.1 dihydroorotase family protein [Streptomyces physcomitrii]